MEEIKGISNSNPTMAQEKYRLIDTNTLTTKHARMMYEMLGVRLNDKNYIIPTSDSTIRVIIEYFEKIGSNTELQEVYYYAGSVYRDLQDSPRSLEYFLKSSSMRMHGEIDSLMLRNCYSQLSQTFFNIQDYKHSLWAAKEECIIAESLGVLDDLSLVHLSNVYLRLKMDSLALDVMDSIIHHQKTRREKDRDVNVLYDLLYNYSFLQNKSKANTCYRLIEESDKVHSFSNANKLALAKYYQICDEMDSCILYYKRITGNLESKYDASKRLFQIYDSLGMRDSAYKYVREFVDASIQLDLGLRQEQAATVNNQYQYYRNEIEEKRLINDKQRYEFRMYCAISGIAMVLLSGLLIHFYTKTRRITKLQNLMECISDKRNVREEKSRELQEEEELIQSIQRSIESNKAELTNARVELSQSLEDVKEMKAKLAQTESDNRAKREELSEAERMLQTQKELVHKKINELTLVNLQLQQAEKELNEKNVQLADKIEQNKHLYMIQHQATLKRDAREMLSNIIKVVEGRQKPEEFDWEEFMTVMDTIYPNFNAQLFDKLGKLKEMQTRTCYLLKAGFSNSQIENLIVGVSRATKWRWIRNYEEALQDIINME